MTDEEHKDLSDRLHATSGFEWIPGMLDYLTEQRVSVIRDGRVMMECDGYGESDSFELHSWFIRPDLRDDATIGCLIALLGRVTQAHVSVNWSVYKRFWEVRLDFFDPRQESDTVTMPTVAEALVEMFEKYDTNREVER